MRGVTNGSVPTYPSGASLVFCVVIVDHCLSFLSALRFAASDYTLGSKLFLYVITTLGKLLMMMHTSSAYMYFFYFQKFCLEYVKAQNIHFDTLATQHRIVTYT
jgi:hypothetical protein